MFKSAQQTDWQSNADQQIWFERFATQSGGLKFSQFQQFLSQTLYLHFASLPTKQADPVEAKFTYQQEIQLFKLFDTKNDHLIDRDEFTNICQNWLDKTFRPSCALVVVDVQNDFIDGSLALINGPAKEDGAEVVPVINKLLSDCQFKLIAYTLDWHPPNHIGFHANLHLRKHRSKRLNQDQQSNSDTRAAINEEDPKSNSTVETLTDNQQADLNQDSDTKFKLKRLATKIEVYDTVLFDEGRVEQKLWPIHCVQNSWGAQLHPKLYRAAGAIYVEKGTLPNVDAYSAFWDNMHLNETGLRQELLSRKISDVFFCGLALDYCVAASALDSVKAGFVTFVIDDACRGIDKEEMMKRKQEMMANGVMIVDSESIREYLSPNNNVGLNLENGIKTCYNNNTVIQEARSISDRSLVMSICYKRALAISSGLYCQ